VPHAADDIAGALARSERALAIRDERQGTEEDEAEVFVARAQALEAAGRADEAASVRERGRRRLREVADGISDPSWRERFVTGLPAHRMLNE
jgi:hypothetical protein